MKKKQLWCRPQSDTADVSADILTLSTDMQPVFLPCPPSGPSTLGAKQRSENTPEKAGTNLASIPNMKQRVLKESAARIDKFN